MLTQELKSEKLFALEKLRFHVYVSLLLSPLSLDVERVNVCRQPYMGRMCKHERRIEMVKPPETSLES
jgi:hypothetical protein